MSSPRSRAIVAALWVGSVVAVGFAGPTAGATSTRPGGASAVAVARAVSPPTAVRAGAAPAVNSVRSDWTGYHGGRFRHGSSLSMPPAHGALAVVHQRRLDGKVYAAPIVVSGITIVATENDTVYAFSPTFALLWKKHLGTPSPAGERPCGNISPLGITGTPVYATTTGLVYVAAELGGPPRHRLYAIGLKSGAVHWSRSLDLPGVQTSAMQERGALTVTGGRVWVPFGGLAGDCGGYKGRLVGVPRNGAGTTASFTVPTSREGGIWTPPGPTLDQSGHLYVAVGNGASGVGDPYDHSDSVLKLSSTGRLLDSFSPSTWATDNEGDLDLGSMGPTLLSGGWIFAAGKSGIAYVLRASHLGGIGGQVSKTSLCVPYGGTASVGNVVYVPCVDGLRAVRVSSTGHIHVLWHAASVISGAPVVGGGRIWALGPANGDLYALDPATGRVVRHIHIGAINRFATPAIYLKYVIIPTIAGTSVVSTS